MSRLLSLLFISLLFLLVSCAQGKSESAKDTPAPDTKPEEDLGVDLVIPDAQPEDLGRDDSGNLGCLPGTTMCVNEVLIFCSDAGVASEVSCGAGEQCVVDHCEPIPQSCNPGAVRCADAVTIGRCADNGLSEAMEPCTEGRCYAGNCRTGAETGAACTQDSECAGTRCYCTNGCVEAPFAGGYCTTSYCEVHGCVEGEVCVNFGIGRREGDFQCVEGCSSCSSGFTCREVPSGGPGVDQVWTEGCFDPAPNDLGESCVSDIDCIGGYCLRTSPSDTPIDGGYCSAPCETQAGCPGGASCIVVDGFLAGGFCALDCVESQCPAGRDWPWGFSCQVKGMPDESGTARVCFSQ